MNKPYLYLFLLFFCSICVNSQNETANWYFGNGAGLSFNNGVLTVLNDGNMVAPEGCTAISDRDGNLKFYSNGETIWNSNHQVMSNGNGLSGDVNLTQNSIVVPNPTNEDIYYLFTLRTAVGNFFSPGVYYSTIDFSSNPLGVVTDKNIRILNTSSERITGIFLPEENYFKVITFSKEPYVPVFGTPPPTNIEINTFNFIDVTSAGVSYSSSTIVDRATLSEVGAMKISPNGQKLAIADNGRGRIFMYNINAASDQVEYTSYINTGVFGAPDLPPYSVEFSPNSKVLYFTYGYGAVFRYDLFSPSLTNDKVGIGSNALFPSAALQLASDGKIYIANYASDGSPSNYMSVIHDPNNVDENSYDGVSINLGSNGSLLGLPNFIQSYFENRILVKDRCVTDTFTFELNAYGPVTSAQWYFGDGNSSNGLTPNHQYDNPGFYIVKAEIEVYGKLIDLYKKVEVFPLPSVEENLTINQCDTETDGIAFFNLYAFEDMIDNTETIDFDLEFYHSYNDALNSNAPIDNPESYENTTNPEQIFVSISSPEGCISISSFYIESTYSAINAIPDMFSCENSDGIDGNSLGVFDLRDKRNVIRNEYNLTTASNIAFYASLQDAQTFTNPLPPQYISSSSTIWVTITGEDGECGGVGPIRLIVNSEISFNIEDTYYICHPSMQPPIVLDGGAANHQWNWLNQSGQIISSQRFFEVSQAGSYSLVAYKTENTLECSRRKDFNVLNTGIPEFSEIIAENSQIQVEIDGMSSYEFSLDGVNYFGSGTSHTFFNVEAGSYTVYVRDLENCEPPISQPVSILNFPKFFTPNNDGYNDTWKIEGIRDDIYQYVAIYIYDRYGKYLYYIDLETNSYGWDGKYNGKMLIASDYWYTAVLIDTENNTFKKSGHFTLKH